MLRKNQKRIFSKVLITASIVALALTLSISAGGEEGKAKIFGKSYGQWSVEWFKWVEAIPEDENPLFSDGEVDLSIGQDGKVWFLAGSWIGPAERQGTVPADKALFFPIFNIWAYNSPGETYTEEELRAMCEGFVDMVSVLSCTVDGDALPVSSVLRPKSILRFQSPAFALDGILGEVDLVVCDGYWVMLPPLSEGEHEIHFHAEIPEYEIVQDVIYNITVVDEDNGV
ncbi:MAG: hypothetical protein JSW23_02140 [Planctomycetota bacterium]|nr:MAG: hypothetical protein JSW23_02140 [Planctomycetota bacterium]